LILSIENIKGMEEGHKKNSCASGEKNILNDIK